MVMNPIQAKNTVDLMRTYGNVPMKYFRQIAASSEQPLTKYVLPSSPAATARRNAIDWLVHQYRFYCAAAERGKVINSGRLKAYDKLQTKLSKCVADNKPVKVSLLDNMASILDKMFQAMLK